MDVARASLEIKRKALEAFTDNGLYPYSRRYLRNIKASSRQVLEEPLLHHRLSRHQRIRRKPS